MKEMTGIGLCISVTFFATAKSAGARDKGLKKDIFNILAASSQKKRKTNEKRDSSCIIIYIIFTSQVDIRSGFMVKLIVKELLWGLTVKRTVMKRNNESKTTKIIILSAALFAVLLLVGSFFFARYFSGDGKDNGTSVSDPVDISLAGGGDSPWTLPSTEAESADPGELSDAAAFRTDSSSVALIESGWDEVNVGYGIILCGIDSYSGEFIEDSSDEYVTDIAAATFRNDSGRDIQYAEVSVSIGGKFGVFKFSTLPSGESVTVLESGRMAYAEQTDNEYGYAQNVVFFLDLPTVSPDLFKVTGVAGYLQIENITDVDIGTDVLLYYKRVKDGRYFGGITYSVRATDGIAAGEKTLIWAPHFDLESCRVMFINYDKSGDADEN